MNQNDSVWFIPDILTGKEERTCTIPEGKAILVPLITGECDTSESPSQSDADSRQCSTAVTNMVQLVLPWMVKKLKT